MFHSDQSIGNGHVEIEWKCADSPVTTQDPWTSVETTTTGTTSTTTTETSTIVGTTTLSTSAFITEGRDDEYYEYLDEQNGFGAGFDPPATCNMLDDVDDFVTHVKERIRAALRSDIFTYSRVKGTAKLESLSFNTS